MTVRTHRAGREGKRGDADDHPDQGQDLRISRAAGGLRRLSGPELENAPPTAARLTHMPAGPTSSSFRPNRSTHTTATSVAMTLTPPAKSPGSG